MTLFEAVTTYIKADGTLNTLSNVYPNMPQQRETYPFAILRRVSGSVAVSHDNDRGLSPVRLEVSVYSDDVTQAEKLVKRLLVIFSGVTVIPGSSVRAIVGGFNGPRSIFDSITRSTGLQLDILMLVDEDSVS